MKFLYYLEVEEWGPFYAEIEIDYEAYPGEPMVRYLPDGSGYPGSPPETEIVGARVTHLEDDKHVYFNDLLTREAMGDWVKDLDRLALEYITSLDLHDTLLSAAQDYYS